MKRIVAIAAVSVLALVACSKASPAGNATGGKSGNSKGQVVKATETEFQIGLSSPTVKAGKVTFEVTNNGGSEHEFVVLKTSDAPNAIAVENGKADETGDLGEVEALVPGTSGTLTLNLAAGTYVLICNLPGHYTAGMRTAFTVS